MVQQVNNTDAGSLSCIAAIVNSCQMKKNVSCPGARFSYYHHNFCPEASTLYLCSVRCTTKSSWGLCASTGVEAKQTI